MAFVWVGQGRLSVRLREAKKGESLALSTGL